MDSRISAAAAAAMTTLVLAVVPAAAQSTQTAPQSAPQIAQSDVQTAEQPAAQPVVQPVAVAQPVAQPIAVAQPVAIAQPVAVTQPVAQTVAQPGAQLPAQPVAVSVTQPAVQPVAQPVAAGATVQTADTAQPAVQPVAQAAPPPVAQPGAQPVAEPAPQPVAQPIARPAAKPVEDTWTGLYMSLGGHAGAMFGGNKLSFEDQSAAQDLTFTTTNDGNSTLLGGGAQLGQLWQFGNVAFGLESDISVAKNINYLSSIRAVLGIPSGPYLIYGTGGAGFESVHEEFTVTSATTGESETFAGNQSKAGFVAGGGIQALVSPHISIGVEGLYYDLGKDSTAMTTPGGEAFLLNAERNFAVVRLRLDYHLGN